MFANSGEITAPCGVPTLVLLRRPPSDTPAFNHFWISRSILVLPVMEKQGRWVRHPKLDQLHQLFMVDVVEEAANVGVQYPVHLLPHDPRCQSIQRIMSAFARPEAVGKAHEVLLVDCFEHRLGRLLDNLVLQRRDAQRALPPVSSEQVHSAHRPPFRNSRSRRLRAVDAPMNPIMKIDKPIF